MKERRFLGPGHLFMAHGEGAGVYEEGAKTDKCGENAADQLMEIPYTRTRPNREMLY
jgi:hypothetical protein